MTFRVCSYNIKDGGTNRIAAIGAVIRNLQPDAVAILEANNRTLAEQLAGANLARAYPAPICSTVGK